MLNLVVDNEVVSTTGPAFTLVPTMRGTGNIAAFRPSGADCIAVAVLLITVVKNRCAPIGETEYD